VESVTGLRRNLSFGPPYLTSTFSDTLVKAGFGGFPRIPGHEIVGDVVAIPASENKWEIGDRVGGGWHGGHCGICNSCRSGRFITCENEKING
jgi:D-arabinose 1-dehydrogenase-like Zn-dependent alcohol dehydrogenase